MYYCDIYEYYSINQILTSNFRWLRISHFLFTLDFFIFILTILAVLTCLDELKSVYESFFQHLQLV